MQTYRGTLRALRDRIEVVGFLAREGDPTTALDGPFAAVPVFRSLGDLLTATRPDAARVMLRNNAMGPVLARLANAGIYLRAEKPVARAAADLQPAREAINRKGPVFTAGYRSRCYGATKYARALVREGLLGPLTFAHTTTTTTTVRIRNPRDPQGYRVARELRGGGIFHWLGCHMIALLLSIVGERPAAVTAFTGTVGAEPVPGEDVAAAVPRFPSGWLASPYYGYLLPTRGAPPLGDDAPEPALYGQRGWVRWHNGSGEARAYSADRAGPIRPGGRRVSRRRRPRATATPPSWRCATFSTPSPGSRSRCTGSRRRSRCWR